ncbi:recombinase-like helix-turn-helix domain-containing protein [Ramlibacter sp.]|uniref:recombinase-like helix-turn-helix domain-containing protein n=1 Tax=Ramlibacter sp. TaxID=1917967 RepID=UPI00345D8E6D
MEPHQTRSQPPTGWENLLADAFERAFAGGAATPQELAAALNLGGPRRPDGAAWTEAELARLGVP